jgi:nitroimidazol reductase NimA-like FMN-containing flavoprotein (pyridoxamine 5'-phosphate oxidase superfamily)
MTKMTSQEKQTFMADLHVGVIGLNEPGSGPLTVPIWYDYKPGGTLWFITGTNSRKGALLEVGARISMAAQTEDAPYRYVSVEGPITSIEPADADTLLAMAVRYLGEKQGKAYASASGLENQVTVQVQPERWLAVDYSKQ